MFGKRLWLIVMAVVIVVGGVTATVLAEPVWQMSSEDGVDKGDEVLGISDTIIGDDPDEDGYLGEVDSVLGDIPPTDQEGNLEKGLNWEEFYLEPQLDGNDGVPGEINDGEIRWSNFYYSFAAGATMRPRDSATSWAYPGGGCVSIPEGTDLFTLPLDLPQGSRIDYLRMFFYDTSALDSIAWITVYDGGGGFTDLVSVTSTGTVGYGTSLSPLLERVVDNTNYSYVLNYKANQTGSSMRLCGLRVAYRLP